MTTRVCGASGLRLPMLSVGLWQNFGVGRLYEQSRSLVVGAIERGIFHFDLANNYGPPPGHAETLFGTILKRNLRGHRDELIISTKAGYEMWPGVHGQGSSRKHLVASFNQSLDRLGVEYVDIFYSHRYDPETPLEETMATLADFVRQGKALYLGVSSYSPAQTRRAASLLQSMGSRLSVHQPSYSMFNRWIEEELLDVVADEQLGCVAFSVLAQGLLTGKYLKGVPGESRASNPGPFDRAWLNEKAGAHLRALQTLAKHRGQSLSQMAIAWSLRDPRISSALIGVSSLDQLDENVGALAQLSFTTEELSRIDADAVDQDIDLWRTSRSF